MESKIDSSDDEANFLIDRNAAMRILSDPLDHKSKHFWTIKGETKVQNIMPDLPLQTDLQVCFHGFAAADDVRNKFSTLRKG